MHESLDLCPLRRLMVKFNNGCAYVLRPFLRFCNARVLCTRKYDTIRKRAMLAGEDDAGIVVVRPRPSDQARRGVTRNPCLDSFMQRTGRQHIGGLAEPNTVAKQMAGRRRAGCRRSGWRIRSRPRAGPGRPDAAHAPSRGNRPTGGSAEPAAVASVGRSVD
jgi:hypothetical protein